MACLGIKKESKKIAHDVEEGITTLGEKLQELKISLEKVLAQDHPLEDIQSAINDASQSIGETETLIKQTLQGTGQLLDLIKSLSGDISTVKQLATETSSDVKKLIDIQTKTSTS